jgi:phospholipid/cholesterol/gamma-HCH transport system substrate-binding protein
MDYRKMSAISGAIIFFSLAALMISIIWMAEKRIFFAPDYVVYVKFDDIVGLGDHSQVYMRGYRVGRTKDVEFLKDGVRVRVDINKKFIIPKDSRWEIHTLNILGEKSITIQPGVSGVRLQPREQVTGINKDMVAMAQNLLKKIQDKIEAVDWDVRVRTMDDSLDKFHALLEKGERKIGELDVAALNRDIGALGELAAELKNAGTDFRKEMAETGQESRDSLAKVERAADQTAALAAKLDEIAGKIGRGEGSMGALVNDGTAVSNLQATLKELQTLLANISKNPKKYFKFSIF